MKAASHKKNQGFCMGVTPWAKKFYPNLGPLMQQSAPWHSLGQYRKDDILMGSPRPMFSRYGRHILQCLKSFGQNPDKLLLEVGPI